MYQAISEACQRGQFLSEFHRYYFCFYEPHDSLVVVSRLFQHLEGNDSVSLRSVIA